MTRAFLLSLAGICSVLYGWPLFAAEPAPTRLEGAAATGLKCDETDEQITVSYGDQTLVVYNKKSLPVPEGMNPLYHRSGFLHPINTPGGKTVTATFPVDHPHQHGVFTAWTKTTYAGREVDFWNLAKGRGRVLHHESGPPVLNRTSEKGGREFVTLTAILRHRIEGDKPLDVLEERWNVIVHAPQDDGAYVIKIEIEQRALTDIPLVIEKYHYGGFAIRGPTSWLTEKDGDEKPPGEKREASLFVNDLGSDRMKGNHEHAKWVAMAGQIDGDWASITAFGDAGNLRAPQAARLHPTKPYFCFAPCVDDKFTIDKDHPYKATYRLVVADGKPDAARLDQWEKEFSAAK